MARTLGVRAGGVNRGTVSKSLTAEDAKDAEARGKKKIALPRTAQRRGEDWVGAAAAKWPRLVVIFSAKHHGSAARVLNMALRFRSLIGAITLSQALLWATHTVWACSSIPDPEKVREGEGCAVAYLAASDYDLGLLQPEWREVRMAFREFDTLYTRVPDDRLTEIRAAYRGQLETLAAKGNAIAHLMLGFEDLEEARTASSTERRKLLYRLTASMATATQGGSNSAHMMLVAIFSAEPEEVADFLPADSLDPKVRTCWRAARSAMESGRDDPREYNPTDPRLWKGRDCIAPTLEALRR